MEIQVGGSKRPFFFLHGHWKGTPDFCFSLAHELGSDQPFYTLEPYQFDGLPVPPTVETMAEAHNKSMRSFQPAGAYLLGGWSNGGPLAYTNAPPNQTAGPGGSPVEISEALYTYYPHHRTIH